MKSGPKPIKVLLSLAPPDGTTRYVDQVTTYLPETVEVSFFSWSAALFGRYDVFHVHWPEFLVRSGSPATTEFKRVLATAFVRRLRRRGTAVVRTLHNVTAHEGVTDKEANFVDAMDELTSLYIQINDSTPTPARRPSVTILHGDYVERFAPLITGPVSPSDGVVLSVGLIRPYKGVLELIAAMAHVREDLSLRVVGQPIDASIRDQVSAAAAANPRVSMEFGFVPDSQLVAEIQRAECVVLPYRKIHNSGILLVALSVGRPVLVPRADTTEELQREVGDAWIQLFDGDIDSDAIDSAVTHFRVTARNATPDFDGRDWRTVGQGHAAAYEKSRELAARSSQRLSPAATR